MANHRVVDEHEQTNTVKEYVVWPKHEPREESKLYKANKEKLIDEMNLPCFKCAMKAWPDKPPPSSYTNREVHHYVVEREAWNAVDPKKVQYLFDNGFFDPYGFSAKMRGQPVESPDDIRNLVVLCEQHHRHAHVGIHHSTAPNWLSDMVAKNGVDILLTEEEWRLLASGRAELGDDGRIITKEGKAS